MNSLFAVAALGAAAAAINLRDDGAGTPPPVVGPFDDGKTPLALNTVEGVTEVYSPLCNVVAYPVDEEEEAIQEADGVIIVYGDNIQQLEFMPESDCSHYDINDMLVNDEDI